MDSIFESARREDAVADPSDELDSNLRRFWIGVGIAVLGNFFGSVGPPLQRVAHQNNRTGVHFTRIPKWWLGFLFQACGEVGNFLAYGFCPASVVAPLGAIGVVSTAVFSRVVLKEHLSWKGISGIALALLGSVLIAYAAPVPQNDPNLKTDTALDDKAVADAIYDSLITWRAFAYTITILTLFMIIANPPEWSFAVSAKMRETNVVWNCVLCGLMGAITVSSSKGFATALSQAFSGNFDMFVRKEICWLTYVLVLCAVGSIIQQLKYLNEALMHFGSSLVVPVYYVLFTSITMSAGMVLFLEIVFDPMGLKLSLFVLGVIMAFAGVYFMNSGQPADEASLDDMQVAKLAILDVEDVPKLKEQLQEIGSPRALTKTRSLGVLLSSRMDSVQMERTRSQRVPAGLTRQLTMRTGGLQTAQTTVGESEIQALFEEMDSNRDGVLDADDLRKWAAGRDDGDEEQRQLAQEIIDYFLPQSDVMGSSGAGRMDFAEFAAWYRRDLDSELRALHRIVLAMRLRSKGRVLAAVVATPGLGLMSSLLLTHRETSSAVGEVASLASLTKASPEPDVAAHLDVAQPEPTWDPADVSQLASVLPPATVFSSDV